MRGTIFIALLISLIVISSFNSQRIVNAQNESSLPSSVSISIVPPKLPADGNTYPAVVVSLLDPSGRPTIAIDDVIVLLSSSEENVVSIINSSVKISAGHYFAIANVRTTKTPGSSLLTASSTGLRSGSATITTIVPTGYPTHLTIQAVPDRIPAMPFGRYYSGTLILELLDDAGLPAKAVSDVTVSLYSSNTKVLNVSKSYDTIPEGDFVHLVEFTTSYVPGNAVITASASQFSSGSTSVTVLGPPPLALKLYAQPTDMVQCVSGVSLCNGRLVIALTDLSGNPARAPKDIQVQIRSSNTTAISVPDVATIRAGTISAVAYYRANPINGNGSAILTISSPGLKSDFVQVNTFRPSNVAWGKAYALKIYVGPNPVFADHNSYSSVVVSLLDKHGIPTISASSVPVTITSSDVSIGNFTSIFAYIQPSQNYVAINFTSTFTIGSTTLTASSKDLLPNQAQLSTFGYIPSRVIVKPIAPTLPADGNIHPALELMLQDELGNPAIAPIGLNLTVRSTPNEIAQVANGTLIQQGKLASIAYVKTSVLSGTANISAFINPALLNSPPAGYVMSFTLLNTVLPSPSSINAYIEPSTSILPRDKSYPLLIIQLQDSKGNPARARQETSFTITASDSHIFNETMKASIPAGSDYTILPLNPLQAGSTSLTIQSQGLMPASVEINIIPFPLKSQLLSSSLTILTNQTASLTLTVSLDNTGLKDAVVKWSVYGGVLSSSNSTTNANGQASNTFTPSSVGVAKIVATVYHPAIGVLNLTSSIIVSQAQVREKSFIQQLLSFPYLLILIGAAVAIVVTTVLMIRRRRKMREENFFGDEGSDMA